MQFFFIKNILIELRSNMYLSKDAKYDHCIIDNNLSHFKDLNGIVLIRASINEFPQYLKVIFEKSNSKITKVIFDIEDITSFKSLINSKFIIINAAGGVVLKNESLLMIYRAGKWELPKGKLEKNETHPVAAIREIKEECNVSARITDYICSTCYAFMIKDKIFFKHINWYTLLNIYDENMKPQYEEGITKVAWIPYKKLEKIIPRSYLSIRSVLDKCFKK